MIAIHYMVIKKIGQGSFGEIYVAQNTSTMEKFAIKAEAGSASHPQLHYESKVYKILAGLGINFKIILLYCFEIEIENKN